MGGHHAAASTNPSVYLCVQGTLILNYYYYYYLHVGTDPLPPRWGRLEFSTDPGPARTCAMVVTAGGGVQNVREDLSSCQTSEAQLPAWTNVVVVAMVMD